MMFLSWENIFGEKAYCPLIAVSLKKLHIQSLFSSERSRVNLTLKKVGKTMQRNRPAGPVKYRIACRCLILHI